MDPHLKIILDKLDEFSKPLDNHDARLDQRFTGLDRDLSARDSVVDRCLAELESSRSSIVDPVVSDRLATLELAYSTQASDITQCLAMLESVHVADSTGDCDSRVTRLEAVAGDRSWKASPTT